MHAAAFALVVNITIAALFAASFAVLGFTYVSQRRALWFSAGYLIGMLTPLSEFLLPLSRWPSLFMVTSYASFTASILSLSVGITAFYRQAIPWRTIALLFAFALAVRAAIWGGTRDWLPYELAYQAPLAVAAAFGCRTVLRVSQRRPLDMALAVIFALITLHFMVKPFVAAAVGSGGTARDYTASTYALVSQATGGILVVAAGLVLLLIVFQRAVTESQIASETDALSGLGNRRGFDSQAQRALAIARRDDLPATVLLFDLDRFKALNDTYGHASGDEVIRTFASLMTELAPRGSVLGRIGGEEFAVLAIGVAVDDARKIAEALREAASAAALTTSHPRFTVSAGVAEVGQTETLPEAIRRADSALYQAKREGRDRVCLAGAN